MASTTSIESVSSQSPIGAQTFWQKLLSFFVRRRVRITVAIFFVLIIEDVLERVEPRNLANVGDVMVVFGLGLVLTGLALRSWAAGTLHKRTQLTKSGPYGLVRHPLYIGSMGMMLGFCMLVNDTENIWFVLGPILVLYVYRAVQEEKSLSAQFADQWGAYAKSVPRFIPRQWPKEVFATWSLKQWIKNREYQAVSAVLIGLVALQAWHLM